MTAKSMLVGVAGLMLAALATYAQTSVPGDLSARQVAAGVDRVFQGRFREVRPGKFGEHALIGLPGAPVSGAIVPLDDETPAEHAGLAAPLAAGHTVVFGLLHVRYKPNLRIELDSSPQTNRFKPYGQALEAIAPTQAAAVTALTWASKHIDRAALPAYADAMHDTPYDARYGGYLISVRPITAHYPLCLTCHHGMKVGQTVAAMVYFVSRNAAPAPSRYIERTTK